jgi:hypothetical protein
MSMPRPRIAVIDPTGSSDDALACPLDRQASPSIFSVSCGSLCTEPGERPRYSQITFWLW